MTAKQFKDLISNRFVSENYDKNMNNLLTYIVIPGIAQCLTNQEKILEKLNNTL